MDNRLFYSSGFNENTDSECQNQKASSSKKKPELDIQKKKANTLNSLNEVEYFLNDFHRFKRYLHLYKFFK